MDIVIQSSSRMKALISAILEYSRIGTNKELRTFDTKELVQNTLIDLSFALTSSKGTVKFDRLPKVTGYQVEFAALMQNLISNALKFRKEGVDPKITIQSHSDSEFHHFRVTDNGIGIDTKNAEKIFQLFSRLNTRKSFEGTGIGLTHSKKIVELHGGKIWISSEVEKGTTFHFTISRNLISENEAQEVELSTAG